MRPNNSNLFEQLPENLPDELFTTIVRGEHVKIQRIVSKGHSSPPSQWYDQNEHEWVIVLKGEARLSFENADDLLLVAGSHINIPAHTKHRVSWTSPTTETVWLAVHYK